MIEQVKAYIVMGVDDGDKFHRKTWCVDVYIQESAALEHCEYANKWMEENKLFGGHNPHDSVRDRVPRSTYYNYIERNLKYYPKDKNINPVIDKILKTWQADQSSKSTK